MSDFWVAILIFLFACVASILIENNSKAARIRRGLKKRELISTKKSEINDRGLISTSNREFATGIDRKIKYYLEIYKRRPQDEIFVRVMNHGSASLESVSEMTQFIFEFGYWESMIKRPTGGERKLKVFGNFYPDTKYEESVLKILSEDLAAIVIAYKCFYFHKKSIDRFYFYEGSIDYNELRDNFSFGKLHNYSEVATLPLPLEVYASNIETKPELSRSLSCYRIIKQSYEIYD